MKLYKTKIGFLRIYKNHYEIEQKFPYYCFVEIPKDENKIPSKELCKECIHNKNPKRSFYLHCGGKVIEEMHEIVKKFNTEVPQLRDDYTESINELIMRAMDWDTCLMDFMELCGHEAAYDLMLAILSLGTGKRKLRKHERKAIPKQQLLLDTYL
jgi:hypothetical protein